MFLWDNTGETRIRFDTVDTADEGGARGAPAIECAGASLAAWLDACTVPIVVHDHARAGILGTATLLRVGQRHLLLTAAHLFDGATSSGNWLVPERATGQLLSLEGAQVRIVKGSDIALIDLTRTPARLRLLHARAAIPAPLALRARFAAHRHKLHGSSLRGTASHGFAPHGFAPHGTTPHRITYCLAGYPAAWSRFERGYLAAKRLTITTTQATHQRHDKTGDLRCLYGRTAERSDGQVIHTPALEGMSGAAIWEVERVNGSAALHLAGVQSAFMHSRYLRGDAADACEPFSRR